MTKPIHMHNNFSQALKSKFLERISKYNFPAEGDGCWEWQGSKAFYNYGTMCFEKSLYRTHRVAYETFIGPIPNGLFVCHHCDNPPCVNPSHLFVGTQTDNIRDKEAKGRGNHTSCQEHGSSKLTNRQVIKIIELYASKTMNQRQLANKFNVHQSQISKLIKGLQFSKLNASINSIDNRKENSKTYTLEQKAEARKLFKEGMRVCNIARKLNINPTSLWFIIHKQT